MKLLKGLETDEHTIATDWLKTPYDQCMIITNKMTSIGKKTTSISIPY